MPEKLKPKEIIREISRNFPQAWDQINIIGKIFTLIFSTCRLL